MGPLLFSPMSEVPTFGRNAPYMASFGLFVILCVPLALVDNYAGLLVLRFLVGFMGSPCLATGGATMQDMVCLLPAEQVVVKLNLVSSTLFSSFHML
jgi:DHA1 family multidrug resistance protein-like MFS transporter